MQNLLKNRLEITLDEVAEVIHSNYMSTSDMPIQPQQVPGGLSVK
jgi:hypothetical protein